MAQTQGLQAYGLLVGTMAGWRSRRSSAPHSLLLVKTADSGHPIYRVALNMSGSTAKDAAEIEYQIVDLAKVPAAAPLVAFLRKRGTTPHFVLASDDPAVPTLDYVRDADKLGLTSSWKPVTAGANGQNDLQAQIEKALGAKGAIVAIWGTGAPVNHRTGARPATGYTGVDNVHMNQGSPNLIRGSGHHLENAPNQDGALVVLTQSSAKAFFTKFAEQQITTDTHGNPTMTGIPKIDNTPATVRKIIMPPAPAPAAAAHTTPATPSSTTVHGAVAPTGFVFADTDPNDEEGQFLPDNDDGTYKTPFVQDLDKGKTRGPVPAPRTYPTLDLLDITGPSPSGYEKTASAETIAFDIMGDSGPVKQAQLPKEVSVTDLLARNAQASPPAFLFHVGDVVYYYGEKQFYYGQFFEPFRSYPAPIFAIPGNHDGVTYSTDMVSLEAFQQVFCAAQPERSDLATGIKRTTMTQPGVYFTLDAPLVSIIGVYSNCGESLGWLDEQQLLFLYQELVRLRALRQRDGRAVILAIHHCPRWFPGGKPEATSTAIDAACARAQFWPDAVLCGHAHIYQRIVRQTGGRDIPYIITGAGGYGLNKNQALAKSYTPTLAQKLTRLIVEYGYVRATVTKPSSGSAPATLRFEYHSTGQSTNEPDDVCEVNLATNQLL